MLEIPLCSHLQVNIFRNPDSLPFCPLVLYVHCSPLLTFPLGEASLGDCFSACLLHGGEFQGHDCHSGMQNTVFDLCQIAGKEHML